ncbi:uncharacterized protein LOC142495013 [Ascaphus truei]|uniref:uncharacterized protein LOC142495013 n=1 Tax=Ascaphus truei TaxID=8439 RepID=UPI003F59244E
MAKSSGMYLRKDKKASAPDLSRFGHKQPTTPAEKKQDGGVEGGQERTSLSPGKEQGEETRDSIITRQDLKAMLQEMQSMFQSALDKAVLEFKCEISALSKRTMDLEGKMDASLQNQVNTDNEVLRLNEEVRAMKDSLDDLENRERRQNLRIHHISESVTAEALQSYLKRLFVSIDPQLEDSELLIDRAHRALGLRFDYSKRSRDVVLPLHQYMTKDR